MEKAKDVLVERTCHNELIKSFRDIYEDIVAYWVMEYNKNITSRTYPRWCTC